MPNYHVNVTTGEKGVCTASIKSCPVSGAVHFTNENEAIEFSTMVKDLKYGETMSISSPSNESSVHQKSLSQWRESLTSEEKNAFDFYGSFEHGEINEALRSGNLNQLNDNQRKVIELMDESIRRSPRTRKPYKVFRGIKTANYDLNKPDNIDAKKWIEENNIKHGSIYESPAYLSTSTSRKIGEEFSGSRSGDMASGIIFEIETRQSAKWEESSYEEEVTLARGSKFEITGVDLDHEIDGYIRPLIKMRDIG